MSRKRTRRLSPEEQALWNKIADTASPMHPNRPAPVPDLKKAVERKPQPPQAPVPEFRIGEKATETALPPAQPKPAVAMDRKNFTRLKRGKLTPQARLDLHGMTLAQAHPALNRFILDAHANGLRLVLVITGKGKRRDDHGPIPARRGLLKHQVPHWLSRPPLNQAVLQVTEAHLRHGGGGALYVYLRRQR